MKRVFALLMLVCVFLTSGCAVLRGDEIYQVEEVIAVKAERYRSCEITLVSDKKYDRPFYDVSVDIELTKGDKTLIVPGFWDGGSTFRYRFALTETGVWSFRTICSDAENTSLVREGSIECVPYTGELEVYKRGFVKTSSDKKYFTYADGTPFFYIGDTHWNMPAEEYLGHFTRIVDRRVEQGFTVYQSQPQQEDYVLCDGVTEEDMAGFADLDKRFKYIADAGLIHANAMLFVPNEFAFHASYFNDEFIRQLTRYWVARYSSYPVMWTLSQEVDDDFYYERGDQTVFTRETNPWKTVCNYVYQYDAYKSPMSAHQEYASLTGLGTSASRSGFAELVGHTWFAAQWSPSLADTLDYDLIRDFYNNYQGKPCVNYEGRYDHLWTGHFGSRAQGWMAFLNGFCGYGYGAADIWLYNGTFDLDTTTFDGHEYITPEDKAIKWREALEFETALQMGYMREFLENYEWYNLIPDFDSMVKCEKPRSKFYCLATISDELYIAYFYGTSLRTMTLCGMKPEEEYEMTWFNPRTGEYGEKTSVTSTADGTFDLPSKPDQDDWVVAVSLAD